MSLVRISSLLLLYLMVTIGISLIGYFFYLNIKSNQELDAERTNIGGRQRILAQKVVKSIFIIGDKRERHKVDAYCTELSIPLAEDNAMEGDREKFLKEGMDDYLSMPINIDEIQTVLTNSANKKYFIGS